MSPFRRQRLLNLLPGSLRVVAMLAAAGFGAVARGDDPATEAEPSAAANYLRLARDEDDNPTALQTSIVRFTSNDEKLKGVEVDLIGAVHIGELDYYKQLNDEFKKYEAVLYELVAPADDNRPTAGRRSDHPIASMQSGMQRMLGLAYQLDEIDYQAENLVHADMSPEQFEGAMANRDENFLKMFMKMYFREVGRMLAEQSKPRSASRPGSSDADLALALFSSNRSQAMKLVLAEQFANMESAMKSIDGPEGSAIISDRNKVALRVLREQIDAGKKKLALFYGAGHMADFQKQLAADFGLTPDEPRWLDAWDLNGPDKPAAEAAEKEPAAAAAAR